MSKSFLSPKTKKRPKSNQPSPHKTRIIKRRKDPFSSSLFSDSDEDNDFIHKLHKNDLTSNISSDIIDNLGNDANNSKITYFNTAIPSYNANVLSTTKAKKKNGESYDSNGVSSDFGFSAFNYTTDAISSDMDKIEEDDDDDDEAEEADGIDNDDVDEYIKNENSLLLSDPFIEDAPILSQKSLNTISSNDSLAFSIGDKTPVLQKRSRARSVFSTSTPKLRSLRADSATTLTNESADLHDIDVSNDYDLKLDAFGRLTTESLKFKLSRSTDSEDADVEALNSETFYSDHSSSNQSANTSKPVSFTQKTPIRSSRAIDRAKSRSFTRTNSSNEHLGVKRAKQIINNAIDQADNVVDLQSLELPVIPNEIEDLKSLVQLDRSTKTIFQPSLKLFLANNKLREINPRLFNLDKLEVLTLRSNKVSSIPGKIRDLTNLRYLQLSGNKLKYLPAEILKLSNLQLLSVRPNPRLLEVSGDKFAKSVDDSHGHTHIAKKKFTGALKVKGHQTVTDFSSFYHKMVSLPLPKVPSLSEMCLRTLTQYDLTNTELKKWQESLSKRHQDLVRSALKNILEERRCYCCGEIIAVEDPTGSMIEYYDILDNVNVPFMKEFCSMRCIRQFLEKEIV